MLKVIDNLLNSITMYRLVLYYLTFLLVVAFIYSIFGVFPFGPIPLIFSTVILIGVCYLTNKLFEKVFKVQINIESFYITGLILALIITPVMNVNGIIFLVVAASVAMASKYIFNIKGKHIFNPASLAVFVTAFTIHGYASWWIGTLAMFPFTLAGVLIVRKIRRFDLVFYFIVTAILATFGTNVVRGNGNVLLIFKNIFIDSPILFFAFIMLTEPLTTPPTKVLQSIYGALTGVFFAPLHIGTLFTTPEIALTFGNAILYLVSPKEKLLLRLKEKVKLTNSIYDFVFTTKQKLNFISGQYLEWTLGQKHTDSRGNRRYFTVATSPTETEIRIGVKFPEDKSSSFKKEMLGMRVGSAITASQLSGDLTMPKDTKQKLVFIGGGIGVTPYRSMLKYLLYINEKRDIVLIYSERRKEDMVYQDIFNEAKKKLGVKVIYFESEKKGHITANFIRAEIPDFKDRMFYLSGSNGMVTGFEEILSHLKLSKKQIKVDYFPGF